MKLKKLAGFTVAAVAAASFAMVSTSAVAATHHTSTKNVKCTGVTTKSGKGYVLVSKSACDELGGTAKAESGATKTKSKTKTTKTTTTTTNTNETATPSAQPAATPAPAAGATGGDNTATTPNQ